MWGSKPVYQTIFCTTAVAIVKGKKKKMSAQLFEEEAPQANTPRNGRGSRTATVEALPAPPVEALIEEAPVSMETPLVEIEEAVVAAPEPPAPAPKPAPKAVEAPAPTPAPVVAPAAAGPRPLPDDRASVTHAFRAAGLDGLLIVGLYEDGTPGETLFVLRQASAGVREALGSFESALNLALPYGVPLSPLARALAALASSETRPAIESLCGYLETRFSVK